MNSSKPLLFLFLLACLDSLALEVTAMKASDRAAGERMLVTGGGIVSPGSNVTLSLEVGSVWERCYWFRYGHLGNAREFDYCSFQLNQDTGIPSLTRCDSEELQAMMIPVAGSVLSCSV